MTLLENYVNSFESVVKFANQQCYIVFEPENENNFEDLIGPIVNILNNQKAQGFSHSQVTRAKMSNFVSAITRKGSFLLPYTVKKLKNEDYKKLEDHCNQLEEITAIFASVNKISAAYRDKCGYVIKRVYELI